MFCTRTPMGTQLVNSNTIPAYTSVRTRAPWRVFENSRRRMHAPPRETEKRR